jgi:hypothetical protein
MSTSTEYSKALDNYYVLKEKYKKQVKTLLKKNPIDIDKEIRCVKCRKKGGTTFSRTVEKEDGGEKEVYLIAKCNTSTPCELDINIKLANYNDYNDLVKTIYKTLEIVKTDIIKLKLDLLFNLKDEDYVVGNFEKLKDKLIKLNGKMDKLRKEYNAKNNTFIIKSNYNSGDNDDSQEIEQSFNRKDAIEYINKSIETTLSKYNMLIKKYKETNRKSDLLDVFGEFQLKLISLFDKKREINHQEANVEFEKNGEIHFDFKQVSIENEEVMTNSFEIIKNVY